MQIQSMPSRGSPERTPIRERGLSTSDVTIRLSAITKLLSKREP